MIDICQEDSFGVPIMRLGDCPRDDAACLLGDTY